MEWMLLPYRRYFVFNGRSPRTEYWLFVLFTVIALTVLGWLDIVLGLGGSHETIVDTGPFGMTTIYRQTGGWLAHLFALFSIIPGLAVGVRRLHDTDKSGWWLLISLIPFAGTLVLIIFLCISGTPGPNRFGPSPYPPVS